MFLGLDASTQSVSAIIIDPESGRVIAEESVNFGSELPEYNAPSGFIRLNDQGEVVAPPLMWLDALDILLARLKSTGVDLSKVRAVSGAGQQHGSVYLNARFTETLAQLDSDKSLSEQIEPTLSRAVSPIWMDSSTSQECEEISQALGGDEKVCQISGSIPILRFTGPQIRKFAKSEPEAYQQTAHIHLVSSFLASVMAGANATIDTGDGAGMNLMDLSANDWSPSLLEATAPELGKKLSPVQLAGSLVGTISSYFVEKYGFSPECQALSWTGDNPASLAGMGAASPGKVVISLGTSDTLFAALDTPVTDPHGHGHVFGNPIDASKYMCLMCFANGSLARERVKNDFNLSWDDFEADALAKTPLGNNGKVAAPFYVPEISPRVNTSQVYTNGWDFDAASTGEKIRATLEGQFLNIKLQSQWMGITPETILITGGASKNNGIAQTIANVFSANVKRFETSSSVALGAAFIAASQSGFNYDALATMFISNSGSETRNEDGISVYEQSLGSLSSIIEDLPKL